MIAGRVHLALGAVAHDGVRPDAGAGLQASVWVQASPSVQAEPSGLFGVVQAPVPGSQVPATLHSSTGVQTSGFFGGFEQCPVDGLQVPTRWHWSIAAHSTGFVPTQAPAWQVSVWVQASPSVQAAPSALFGLEQAPVAGSQTPAS